MKKLFITLTVCLLAVFTTKASTADLFSFNETELAAEFADLTELEQIVELEGVTYSDLAAANHSILANVNLDLNVMNGIMGAMEGPLGIPSFVWGLCLSVWGILIVYLVTDDTDETKKALWGCVAGAVVYVAFWVVWVVLIGNSFWWGI